MNHEKEINKELTTEHELIAPLLPRYYEARGDNPTYEIVDCIEIEGHEIAWMHYEGKVTNDIMKLGREGKKYEGHVLKCACHFTEDVGWVDRGDGRKINLLTPDHCKKRELAVALRHLNLHQEYLDKGMLTDRGQKEFEAIIFDLIEKRKADEFLEDSSGAEFWGGYFYLQTAAEIAGIEMREAWQFARQMQVDKKIRLEGAVVQTYPEPKEPIHYILDEIPKPVIYKEKEDKVWAIVPRPDSDLNLEELEVTEDNYFNIIRAGLVGLGHTPELATARLMESIQNPRLSYDRLYQQSFIELEHKAGALAVIAYSARNSQQPEEWVVEGFVGDSIVPEVHTLTMYHNSKWGIDVEDRSNLNQKVDVWWPN